ncbi:MAG: ribokinase [Chloroflexi bacterium]|nr:ribokinase [Chloroflexota bacterium]
MNESIYSNTAFDIVVVGSNMVDLLSKIPRLPKMGETLVGTHFHMGFGGKGANQAIMAARLGAKVAMVTRVGDDTFGVMTRENFRQQGIATDYVFVEKGLSSGVAPILVDETGHNLIVIVPGANMKLSPTDVRQAEGHIRSAKVLISQLEIADDAILEAFTIAHQAGVKTILNPAPARPIPLALIRASDWIVPNESEAELLTGMAVKGRLGAEEASRRLVEQGARSVILTLGEDGALIYEQREARYFPAYPVQAVDTTGAGDAFIGGLAYAIARGDSLQLAIEFANKCAALSVMKVGTQVSFPTLAEVEGFTRAQGTAS